MRANTCWIWASCQRLRLWRPCYLLLTVPFCGGSRNLKRRTVCPIFWFARYFSGVMAVARQNSTQDRLKCENLRAPEHGETGLLWFENWSYLDEVRDLRTILGRCSRTDLSIAHNPFRTCSLAAARPALKAYVLCYSRIQCKGLRERKGRLTESAESAPLVPVWSQLPFSIRPFRIQPFRIIRRLKSRNPSNFCGSLDALMEA